jgi:hypothetical protein
MSTTGKGFRYPQYSDTPDVPRDLGYLAEDVDAYLDAHPGPQGPAGTITIGEVTTVGSSTPASVTNTGSEEQAVLNFVIPRGVDGIVGGDGPAGPSNVLTIGNVVTGETGTDASATITGTSPSQVLNLTLPRGPQGIQGLTGPKGDAAATIIVESTTTGASGTNASVTNSGTSSDVKLNFVIPQGPQGIQGVPGIAGADGANASLDPIAGTIGLNIPTSSSYGVNSNWYPIVNNYVSIGQPIDAGLGVTSNKFWKTIYSNTGTINTSDLRLKTDVVNSSLGLDFINNLRPVSYKFIEGSVTDDGQSIPGTRTHWGLIAQEVKQAVDEADVDFAGWVLLDKENVDSEQALRYEEFIAPLIKAVQELTARVKALEEA